MSSLRYALHLLILCLTLLACVSVAQAQNQRTFVSGGGNDVSPDCTAAAPCRTFANALTKTSTGGEINAMDAADYGIVTVDKSVTIDGKGTGAYISVPATSRGVRVRGAGSDRITIRNLSINGHKPGAGPGSVGILFETGNVLSVENVVIQNFSGNGINFSPSIGEYLIVKDSFIRNCDAGILVQALTSGLSRAAIDNTRIEDCNVGIWGVANSRVNVRDSFFTANVDALRATVNTSELTVTHSGISHNTRGVRSAGAAVVRIAGNTITFNSAGLLSETGGQILSAGDNTLSGNGFDGVPTGPIPPV